MVWKEQVSESSFESTHEMWVMGECVWKGLCSFEAKKQRVQFSQICASGTGIPKDR